MSDESDGVADFMFLSWFGISVAGLLIIRYLERDGAADFLICGWFAMMVMLLISAASFGCYYKNESFGTPRVATKCYVCGVRACADGNHLCDRCA
jgi:hypothetical protein